MNKLNVLVVDDDIMIALLLTELVEGMGHSVCAMESSEDDAVASALRHHPDLMIVDDDLDGGSGCSVVDKVLRKTYIPHFFIGGDLAAIHRHRPHAVALQKPFDQTDLVGAMQRALHAPFVS